METLADTFNKGAEVLNADPAGIRGGAVTAKVPTTDTNIPVEAIDNSVNPLEIPQPELDPSDAINTATTGADAILAQNTKDAQATLDSATTQQTAADARVQELFGITGQAPAVEKTLEEQVGLKTKERLADQISAKAGLVQGNKQLFDLATNPLSYKNQLDASTRDITKGTFNAQDSRFRVERALESNRQASELVGLNAQFQIASGDVKRAQESVAQAMDIFYKPIETELEMQKLFFSRNERNFSSAQKGLADAKNTQIERQFAEIDTAKILVTQAVGSGVATPEEVAQMTDTNLSANDRSSIANSVLARGSKEDRDLSNQLTNAQIRSQNRANKAKTDKFDPKRQKDLIDLALMGDKRSILELGYDPNELGSAEKQAQFDKDVAQNQEEVDNLDGLLENDTGLQAASGDIQSPLISGFLKPAEITGGAGDLARFTPIIGNVRGAVLSSRAKKTFLSETKFVIEGQGFKKLIEYKEGGATFGSLSDPERIAIKNSASKLASSAIWNEAGTEIKGFDVPEDVLRGYIADIQRGLADEKDIIISDFMPEGDKDEASVIWNE